MAIAVCIQTVHRDGWLNPIRLPSAGAQNNINLLGTMTSHYRDYSIHLQSPLQGAERAGRRRNQTTILNVPCTWRRPVEAGPDPGGSVAQ